jgi:hypothetical protein
METEKKIDTENLVELTTREQSVKQMLHGMKGILRLICELNTEYNAETS